MNNNSKWVYGFLFFLMNFMLVYADQPVSAYDVLNIKNCSAGQISQDGKFVLYLISRNRSVRESPGSAYRELYLTELETKTSRPLITGNVNISSPSWHPDGVEISFVEKRGESKYSQVWTLSLNGGEPRQITQSQSSVLGYVWHPDGKKVFYTATPPISAREEKLKEKGFEFIYYEEDSKPRNLYMYNLDSGETSQLTSEITVWDLVIDQKGERIALSVSPKNLIDQRYMFRKLKMLDLVSGKLTLVADRKGKLGNYAFSPDGSKIAFNASLDLKDNQVSQVFVVETTGGEVKNMTPKNLRGHVKFVGWKNNEEVFYLAEEGVWTTLCTTSLKNEKRVIIYDAEKQGVNIDNISVNNNFNHFAITGTSSYIPAEIFYWDGKNDLMQITEVNSWLKERTLGLQDMISYRARDGEEIEGIIIYPVNYQAGSQYPLIIYIHGGPEHHNLNSWLTTYSLPGQAMAGKGYIVYYPNYRSSTGYGTDFSLSGYGDPAGKEFDDIADGIDFFVREGLADKERVGLAGGSYGGYAAAWFSSYYTKKVKAVSMFAGVSDLISKRGTTDITYEELYVHSGKKLEEMWQLSLERSPIYWAHQSKTAVLIANGQDDSRVHPAQSLEYYYRLKMNDHPAVRLVRYPGEKHGLSKQPARTDFILRQIDWMDWYVKEGKPLTGPMPPLDLSNAYGLDMEH